MRFEICDINAFKQDISAAGTVSTTDQIEQCGFACTVGTHQSHDFSFANGKIDMVESTAIVKSFT
jgi:hypothetical protein